MLSTEILSIEKNQNWKVMLSDGTSITAIGLLPSAHQYIEFKI